MSILRGLTGRRLTRIVVYSAKAFCEYAREVRHMVSTAFRTGTTHVSIAEYRALRTLFDVMSAHHP
jgi:hypothetical protein